MLRTTLAVAYCLDQHLGAGNSRTACLHSNLFTMEDLPPEEEREEKLSLFAAMTGANHEIAATVLEVFALASKAMCNVSKRIRTNRCNDFILMPHSVQLDRTFDPIPNSL